MTVEIFLFIFITRQASGHSGNNSHCPLIRFFFNFTTVMKNPKNNLNFFFLIHFLKPSFASNSHLNFNIFPKDLQKIIIQTPPRDVWLRIVSSLSPLFHVLNWFPNILRDLLYIDESLIQSYHLYACCCSLLDFGVFNAGHSKLWGEM